MTTTKTAPIRIHTHFGRIALEDSDGYLSVEQADALAVEILAWVTAVKAGNHPATRLVRPDGRRVNENGGDTAMVTI